MCGVPEPLYMIDPRVLSVSPQEAERELSTAYTEVATLQQQLAERDEDVHNLQQRMCNETKQWVSNSLANGLKSLDCLAP